MAVLERFHRWMKGDAGHTNNQQDVEVALLIAAQNRLVLRALPQILGDAVAVANSADPVDSLTQKLPAKGSPTCPVALADLMGACAAAGVAAQPGAVFYDRLGHERVYKNACICAFQLKVGHIVRRTAACMRDTALYRIAGFVVFPVAGGNMEDDAPPPVVYAIASTTRAETAADVAPGAPLTYDPAMDIHVRFVNADVVVFPADTIFNRVVEHFHISSAAVHGAVPGPDRHDKSVLAKLVPNAFSFHAGVERVRA